MSTDIRHEAIGNSETLGFSIGDKQMKTEKHRVDGITQKKDSSLRLPWFLRFMIASLLRFL
jgi:hypothetical protein